MANDGASSMSNLTAITPGAAPSPRPVGLPVHDTRTGTVITAEIPAVKAGPSYGVLLPDGTVWYPGSRKRLPAPLVLRVVVWILAFAVLFAAAGDVIIHYRPSWVAPLRHVVTASAPAPPSGTTGTVKTASHTSRTASFRVIGMSPEPADLVDSSVPTNGYWVGGGAFRVTVATSAPAFVEAWRYVDGNTGTVVLNGSVFSGGSFVRIPGHGTIVIEIGANGTTISVSRGTKTLRVPTPPSCPCNIVFDPTH